jgi:hypothetical protein
VIESLASLWSSLSLIQDELVGLGFTLFGVFLLHIFRARVKLTYGRANNSRNVISVPDGVDQDQKHLTEIYVEKFFLQNSGRKPATSVEFVLSDRPADITIWQPRDVEIKKLSKGECFIHIPQIAPGELVIIDCVYLNQRAAWISSVKCAEALGKEVAFFTVRQFPRWFYLLTAVTTIFGVAFFIQIVIKFLGE